jgi:hypothetical protein
VIRESGGRSPLSLSSINTSPIRQFPPLPPVSLPALAARCSPLLLAARSPRSTSSSPSHPILKRPSTSTKKGSSFRTPHHHLTLKTQKKKEIVIQDGQPQDPEAVRMRDDGGGLFGKARGEARQVEGRIGWVDGEEGLLGRMYEGDREERSSWEDEARRGKGKRWI